MGALTYNTSLPSSRRDYPSSIVKQFSKLVIHLSFKFFHSLRRRESLLEEGREVFAGMLQNHNTIAAINPQGFENLAGFIYFCTMNIHYFQHESFEDLACIQYWADKPGNKITCTKFFESYTLPDIDSIDMLIIMGGPMGVYEENIYPWLKEEKKFIAQAIQKKKKIVGICLGSQLIAEVLGAKVYKNKEKEIGWFEIEMTEEAKKNIFFKDIPSPLYVFHWHGDTFDLPEGAIHIAQSKACKNQAFTYENHVIALQFHMEATKKSIEELAFNCKEEIVEAPYIQTEKEIISNAYRTENMNLLMYALLDKMN